MSHDLISKKTRNEFREFLVGWVIREIEDAFDAAGIVRKPDCVPAISGARRSLVEQYYASLDFADPRDVSKVLRAFEYVLSDAFEPKADGFAGRGKGDDLESAKKLVNWLRKDGYEYVDGRLVGTSGIARVDDVRLARGISMHLTLRKRFAGSSRQSTPIPRSRSARRRSSLRPAVRPSSRRRVSPTTSTRSTSARS